jgi:hypothetical protein
MKKKIQLRPVIESIRYYEKLEIILKKAFKKSLYSPIYKYFYENPQVRNAPGGPLFEGLRNGVIYFKNGYFYGDFNSAISRELKFHGAQWDEKKEAYRLDVISAEVHEKIELANENVNKKIAKVLLFLSTFSIETFLFTIDIEYDLRILIKKVERDMNSSLKLASVLKESKIKKDELKVDILTQVWKEDVDAWTKAYTEKEINSLEDLLKKAQESDNRYEKAIKAIEKSELHTDNKTKAICHDGIRSLVAKLKAQKYMEAGIKEYKWVCVNMPHDKPPPAPHILGNVRYSHGILDQTIQRWDSPPISTNPGEPPRRNNPGEDWGCRCYSVAILKF